MVGRENQPHHNNILVLGNSERVQGTQPIIFSENFLITLLDLKDLSPTFVVGRVHRVPLTPPIPGTPFLICLLNYRDQDMILLAARSRADLAYENSKVSSRMFANGSKTRVSDTVSCTLAAFALWMVIQLDSLILWLRCLPD